MKKEIESGGQQLPAQHKRGAGHQTRHIFCPFHFQNFLVPGRYIPYLESSTDSLTPQNGLLK
ncbi:TPA: hypothetical protein ACHOZF_000294 [Raoultella planticola]